MFQLYNVNKNDDGIVMMYLIQFYTKLLSNKSEIDEKTDV